jgi:glycosyltransferase involved in cell wall biosynthesis
MADKNDGGDRPIRILHVLGGMNRGGVETWLMHVLRNIDRKRYRMDFLVHTTKPCAYDDEIRALGSQIIPCLRPSKPWLYARNFMRAISTQGPYDIVHSHVNHYTGFVLRLAHRAGVPLRIAHSHNDTRAMESAARVTRRIYLRTMRGWIERYSTLKLACSRVAADSLYDPALTRNDSHIILHYGIDLSAFSASVDRNEARAEFDIPQDAVVFGHVGRFFEQKNHTFLLNIAAEASKREPRTRLLLVGDGPLREEIAQKAHDLGIGEVVIFAGVRSDISRLMMGVMDVFILPSLHEGLPLVALEAQAAGLPCLLADVITHEIDVIGPLVHRMGLSEPPSAWAKRSLANLVPPIARRDAARLMSTSGYSISSSANTLLTLYRTAS